MMLTLSDHPSSYLPGLLAPSSSPASMTIPTVTSSLASTPAAAAGATMDLPSQAAAAAATSRMASCFLLPSSPYLKLAFLPQLGPRLFIGYTNYPPTTSPPIPRFPRQTLALPSPIPNGTYRTVPSALQPRAPGVATTTTLRAGFVQQTTFHTGTSTFHKGGFSKGTSPGKGVKRKADDSCSPGPDGDVINGKVDSVTGEAGSGLHGSMHPLYCKVCRVTLNAPLQAKQHYEGKSHAKKMKLHTDGPTDGATDGAKNGETKSGQEQPSSTTNGTTCSAEINPEVYCKICGVSFNSPKQATQHYQGKSHAKKVRATNTQNNNNNNDTASNNKYVRLSRYHTHR